MPLSLQKYHSISLNTPTQLRFIDMVRQQIAEVDRRRAANICVYHGLYNNDKNNMICYSHFYQNLYMLRSRLRGDGRRYFFWKISAKIRINEPSDQRTFGSTNLRTNEPSDQRTFGTMNLRNKKPSEQRHGTFILATKSSVWMHEAGYVDSIWST